MNSKGGRGSSTLIYRSFVGLATAVLLAATVKAQTFNCYEGQGVLENAWNDWSWCTDNVASTTYHLSGTKCIQVSYTAGYQGFSLESSNSFKAEYFTALSFYICGGKTAGRSINVQLTVNGQTSVAVDLNKYCAGGGVPTNGWAHVFIPLAAFGVKPNDEISRFWLQESSGSAQPSFWLDLMGWIPVNPSLTAITVNPQTVGQTLASEMFGANTAVWDSNLDTTACKNLVAQAGFKSFRFPGGSLSDGYNWATNETDQNTWQWATNFDQFADMAAPAKGECLITANYGTGTPAEAAAWVTYSNKTKKYGMKRWEIGNECYGTWEEDSHAKPNDPVTYATEFAQYYKQMKAADPTILIGAVSTPGEDNFANYPTESVKNPRTGVSHSGWTPLMLSTLASLKVVPDFIIYHRYPEYVNDCDFTLLVGNDGWTTDMQDLRQEMTDYLGQTTSSKTQILCTENNCDAGPEGKQMCSLVNGIYMADSFGSAMNTECKGFLWWDLINGQNTTADNGSWLYGWRQYGDEGVISPDFTQTYPVFYIESLLNLFAQTGDSVVSATTSNPILTAYATKRSDNSLRLLIVNKSNTATIATKISIAGYTPQSTATLYSYGMPQDNAAKAGNPQTLETSSVNVGTTTSLSFAPYSATVLVFKQVAP